jgi:hypothetical protein
LTPLPIQPNIPLLHSHDTDEIIDSQKEEFFSHYHLREALFHTTTKLQDTRLFQRLSTQLHVILDRFEEEEIQPNLTFLRRINRLNHAHTFLEWFFTNQASYHPTAIHTFFNSLREPLLLYHEDFPLTGYKKLLPRNLHPRETVPDIGHSLLRDLYQSFADLDDVFKDTNTKLHSQPISLVFFTVHF